MAEKNAFIQRLVDLRLKKGVSARDMSLSLGQSAGYINNIESGVNYPSMTVFFYICESVRRTFLIRTRRIRQRPMLSYPQHRD